MAPLTPPRWITAETEPKEADFRGILNMQVPAAKGAMATARSERPYLYVDLHAGRGHLEYEGHRFLGSPLIAQDVLTKAGLLHEAIHFERDPDEAALLAEALWVPTSLLDCPDPTTAPIFVETCQEGFARWLDDAGMQRDRYGLIYADPVGKEIPHALLNKAAHVLPKVDLLSYVAATRYKRERGSEIERNGHSDKPILSDHINAIDKRVALIRNPRGAWQFTFVLWSNWVKLPDWQRRGFHRLDSEAGARILDQLDLTERQHREKANTPLPFQTNGEHEPPYRTYREYLRHPRFVKVRAEVFTRAGGKCERCGLRPPTEPHHLRYPPWGTFDVPENMIAVCHPCHCEIHGKER